jgi:hypothetical protein
MKPPLHDVARHRLETILLLLRDIARQCFHCLCKQTLHTRAFWPCMKRVFMAGLPDFSLVHHSKTGKITKRPQIS